MRITILPIPEVVFCFLFEVELKANRWVEPRYLCLQWEEAELIASH